MNGFDIVLKIICNCFYFDWAFIVYGASYINERIKIKMIVKKVQTMADDKNTEYKDLWGVFCYRRGGYGTGCF